MDGICRKPLRGGFQPTKGYTTLCLFVLLKTSCCNGLTWIFCCVELFKAKADDIVILELMDEGRFYG